MHWKFLNTNTIKDIILCQEFKLLSAYLPQLTLPQSEVKFLNCFVPSYSNWAFAKLLGLLSWKRKKKWEEKGENKLGLMLSLLNCVHILASSALPVLHLAMVRPHWQVFSFGKVHTFTRLNMSLPAHLSLIWLRT